MKSINPFTGKLIKEYTTLSDKEAAGRIALADAAFDKWRKTDFATRSDLMLKAAEILLKNKDKYARLITDEMGKAIKEARAEIEKCAFVCKYYADNAEKFLQDEKIITEAQDSFVTYQPMGVILAVMPWNFPFWQVFRFAAPSLMAGNTCVLKHASNVSACALAIEEVFVEAGFPQDVFKTLLIKSTQVAKVIKNKAVRAVTLTGSTQAGKSVAKVAGSALKKTVLELGGSDAYIVLADADVKKSAALCLKSRMINAGQSCIAAKRFIVVSEIYDEFVAAMLELMKGLKTGNPLDEQTDIGPMANLHFRNELHKQVEDSIAKGAKCLLGGKIEGDVEIYQPTLLVDVARGMPAYKDEIFGPVVSIIKARNAKNAVAIANSSVFGLGSAIFTGDIAKAKNIARKEIEAGACFINDFVKSDPRLPFGGVKESGYGRELSYFGIREFVNIKTVVVA